MAKSIDITLRSRIQGTKDREILLNNHHVITIGTSAGGVSALKTLLGQLPKDLKASIHIVQHLSGEASSNLAAVLNKVSRLPVAFARDRAIIEIGRIYLAPPNFHLIFEPDDRLRLVKGPRENRMRPSIDPLFRSAAVVYRSYATGIILTGMLDDGTAGLQAIKACGGMAIAQAPEDAVYRSMPESAIANVEVDRIVPLAKIPEILQERVRQTPPIVTEVPPDLLLEMPIAEKAITAPQTMAKIGQPVAHACPSCGGPLWQIGHKKILRYRCHVGHAFTDRTLIEEQNEATEKALWIALRTLEERGRLLKTMSDRYAEKGAVGLAQIHQERAKEAVKHALLIRNLIRNLRTIAEFSEEKAELEID